MRLKVKKTLEKSEPFFPYQPEMTSYYIVDEETLPELADRMSKISSFAYDVETNTLAMAGESKDSRVVCISISWGYDDNYYIPIGHLRDEDIDLNINIPAILRYLKPQFEREDVYITGRNLKFDLHCLARIGIFVRTKKLFDSMIASWLCDENTPNGLKEDSQEKLGIDQTHFAEVVATVPNAVKKQFGLKAASKATYDLVLIDDGAPYALADSFYSFILGIGYEELLVEEKMDAVYWKVYRPFLYCLFEMEERGVDVDTERLEEMRVQMKADMDNLTYEMTELLGAEFNPSSGQQLAEILFGYRKLNKKGEEADSVNEHLLDVSFGFKVVSKTKAGAPSTDGDTIMRLARSEFKAKRKLEGVEFCKLLLKYKKLDKLYSAFIVGLEKNIYDDGKVHPSFNIIGTDSGRISCSSPNLQQLPKADEDAQYKIRSLFIGSIDPNTGKRKKIIALDYSNLEMRVLAHFSKDKNLLEMFEKGQDTHGSTAVNMFELDCDPNDAKKLYPHLRQAAKTINFLLMYGGGAFRLYNSLKEDPDNPIDLGDQKYLDQYGVKTGEEVAQIYIDKYFSTYSGVASFIKAQKKYAKKHGFVYTLLMRKRRLPFIHSDSFKEVAYAERLSVNSCIQGSAGDITMSAQNRINEDEELKEVGCLMLIQVHDELVFECPEEYVEDCIERIKWYMEHPFGDDKSLNLPLKVDADFGDSYSDAK